MQLFKEFVKERDSDSKKPESNATNSTVVVVHEQVVSRRKGKNETKTFGEEMEELNKELKDILPKF